MNLRDTIKKILKEELGDTRLIRQKHAIEKLLNSKSFEGVCGWVITQDKINDRVGAVILKFSSDWFHSNFDEGVVYRKKRLIEKTKYEVEKEINRFLGIKGVYVGNVFSDCNSSSGDK
jgi:hypothetical protein